MKVANYWRIAKSIVDVARSLRRWFSNLEMAVLEPYSRSLWLGQKRFVHAEIQIVVYYELSVCAQKPRVIGASKEACFLCDAFVRAHQRFRLSKAHRRLFDQWTVPDLKEYTSETRTRLQDCLKQVHEEINREKSHTRYSLTKRAYPHQSSINLLKAVLRSPSRSTIRSHVASSLRHGSPSVRLSSVASAGDVGSEPDSPTNDQDGAGLTKIKSSARADGPGESTGTTRESSARVLQSSRLPSIQQSHAEVNREEALSSDATLILGDLSPPSIVKAEDALKSCARQPQKKTCAVEAELDREPSYRGTRARKVPSDEPSHVRRRGCRGRREQGDPPPIIVETRGRYIRRQRKRQKRRKHRKHEYDSFAQAADRSSRRQRAWTKERRRRRRRRRQKYDSRTDCGYWLQDLWKGITSVFRFCGCAVWPF